MPNSGQLIRSKLLDPAEADQLATVIRQLNLAKPSGAFNCPADLGQATVIGFAHPQRPDVGLWYASSGCQTLDNGQLGAFQGANPSFYNTFESVINNLLPAVSP